LHSDRAELIDDLRTGPSEIRKSTPLSFGARPNRAASRHLFGPLTLNTRPCVVARRWTLRPFRLPRRQHPHIRRPYYERPMVCGEPSEAHQRRIMHQLGRHRHVVAEIGHDNKRSATTTVTMRMPKASARTLLVLSGPVVMCRKKTR